MTAVVLDTDIGMDIDDTWALAMLLCCPELDVRLVTTVTGDPTYRARLAAGILTAAGRDDVPVGIGVPTTLSDGVPARPQGRFADEVALDRYRGAVHQDGVAALVECVMSSEEPITVIAIGPMSNIGAALALEPAIAEKARLVGMLGCVRGVGSVLSGHPQLGDGPVPEYNVVADVAACRAAFEASWETTITPLDTCGDVVLRGERYRKVCEAGSPLIQAVLRNYEAWHENWLAAGSPWRDGFDLLDDYFGGGIAAVPFWKRSSTVLFDTVAVYLAYDESLLNIERLPIALDERGLMSITPGAPELRVATSWRDRDQFEDQLVERLTSPKT
jgi:inosine-uridine nucleoside N-ribohydrolase